jgi:hypothetical protein
MNKDLSIVLVDKRHHRKIAQDNWGLTDEQMEGKHVHHRIHRSKGGTNDPSNLYVCSSWFHQHVWHNGEEWIEWASEGGKLGAESCRQKRENDDEWAKKEKERNSVRGKRMHERNKGTAEYSEAQRLKSLKTHISKRSHWTEDEYNLVWNSFLDGFDTGYKVSKRVKSIKAKTCRNMLKSLSLGMTFQQVTNKDLYIEESLRLQQSPVHEMLKRYDD